MVRHGALSALCFAACSAVSLVAAAQCLVGTTITVDNDVPGSGYSEEKPENWLSNNVSACQGTYRYLSHTVGDGTRKDRATWQPKIAIAGYYEVTTGFRATVNRTSDADYVLHDDKGGSTKKVVNQQQGNGCTKVVIGTIYCAVGGTCRLVLDGTDDSQSDSTDVTTFKLVSCDGFDAGPPGPCAGIAANPSYEVCEETPQSCAGVFTDGSGCVAFCAAAGMTCSARYGGEPGCLKEPNNPLGCADDNGHGSDYCECVAPPVPDAGTAGGGGVSNADGGAAEGGALGEGGGANNGWGATGAVLGGGSSGTPRGETRGEDQGGCGCRVSGRQSPLPAWGAWLLAGLFLLRRRG
ncbi:MAG: MYXO-CTERM sorting domain-containing protein [Polyangiaceae bacterium]